MIRLSMACVDKNEIEEIEKVLFKTVNFGLGVHVDQFEQEIKKFIQTDAEVICVNTGTAALHASLAALNFPTGSEVIVPSITFVASLSAISAAGLKPICCDVLSPSCHIDPKDAENRITNKTVAIMPVAYSGTDFDRKAIYDLASKYNLRVIEDDAHAFGSKNNEDKLFGASGDIICFSFDGIKNITTGEGGAIVTHDKVLARKIRIIRSLGIEKDVDLRYFGQRAWEYDVAVQGYRYHMSNINAAIGLSQLKKINKFFTIKQELISTYLDEINKVGLMKDLIFTQADKNYKNAILHIAPFLLTKNINRSYIRNALKDLKIESGFHYVPNHLHSMYKTNYSLPFSEFLGEHLISLPFHANLIPDDCRYIVRQLNTIIRNI